MMNITNSSSQIIDKIYEENNTKYLIFDCANGKIFDQFETNHVHDIIEIIVPFTKLVHKYYKQGYLMLDIKPEIFLILDETNQLINT